MCTCIDAHLGCSRQVDNEALEPTVGSRVLHLQFEMRYNEVERARAVFERYVEILPSVKAWVRFAKFELQNNDVARARSSYERAMEALGDDGNTVSSCFILHVQ